MTTTPGSSGVSTASGAITGADLAAIQQTEAQAARGGISAKVVGAAHTTTHVGGNIVETTQGYQRVDSADLGSGDGSIMSTARSINGRPLSGNEIKPDTMLTYEGLTTSAAALATIGVLRRNAQGIYEEVGNSSAAPAQQPQQAEPQPPEPQTLIEPTVEPLDDTAEALHC